MGHITLYTHSLSANGRKILTLSELLNLKIEIKWINVYHGEGQTEDFFNISPLGQIPALKNNSDGHIVLESNAIMIYLCEMFGDCLYYPKESKQRSAIHQWLFWESSQWQPAISVVLREIVGHRLLPNIVPAPMSTPNWNEPLFIRQLKYLESHLMKHEFLAGESLTIADLSVTGMMMYFRFAAFEFDFYPAIKNWYDYIEALPSWKKTENTLWAV